MKNRKKKERYQFINASSIKDLEIELANCKKQLLSGKDDPRWVNRWIERIEKEIAKKEKSLDLKNNEN